MKKRFNITGICVPSMHYMVNTSSKISTIFYKLIEHGGYFSINRARQYGKTTTIALLRDFLESKEDYFVIETSFEGVGTGVFENDTVFCNLIIEILVKSLKNKDTRLAQDLIANINKIDSIKDLSQVISHFVKTIDRKVILIIDEIDKSSNNDLFLNFLGMLRDKYLLRNRSLDFTFHSVVLVGMHDIKTIKLKIRNDENAVQNSPWNIAIDFNIDLSFKASEIVSMLESYSNETGISMDMKAISEQLYFYTNGYPFLVSWLCKYIDEEIIIARDDKNWTVSDVDAAFRRIAYSGYTTTLFDSLSKNLVAYPDMYRFIYDIVIDNKYKSFTLNDPIVSLANTHGLIRDDSGCKIHNRIFEQRIYDMMISIRSNSKNEASAPRLNAYFKGNDIDLEFILVRFQQFFKENYSHRDQKFIEREGRLIFLSYLQPIINSKGYVFKEPVVGDDRRMDLVITHNNKRYVLELKIWYGGQYHQDGLQQMSDYLDIYALKKGFLVIFNFNQNKEFKKETIAFEDKEIFTVWV